MEALRNLVKPIKDFRGNDMYRPIELIRDEFNRYPLHRRTEIEQRVLNKIHQLEVYIYHNQVPTTHNINVHLALNEARSIYKFIFQKNSPTNLRSAPISQNAIWNGDRYEWFDENSPPVQRKPLDKKWGKGLFTKK